MSRALRCALVGAVGVMGVPGVLAAQHGLAGSLSLVGDYRFRGLSQTYTQPAVQGGGEYTHASGLYAGVWGSNVSGNQFLNGGSLELDLYGGYRARLGALTLDVGLLYYWYPGARYNLDPGDGYNTLEAYAGAAYGPVTAKVSYAMTDLFGMHTRTIGGSCGLDADGSPATGPCLGGGSSEGSVYLDVGAALILPAGLGLALHAGRQEVRSYDALSYTDFKVGLTRAVASITLGLALVGTDAERRFYRFTPTSGGGETEDVSTTTVVASASKSF